MSRSGEAAMQQDDRDNESGIDDCEYQEWIEMQEAELERKREELAISELEKK